MLAERCEGEHSRMPNGKCGILVRVSGFIKLCVNLEVQNVNIPEAARSKRDEIDKLKIGMRTACKMSADSGHEVGHDVLEALRVRAHDLDRRHVRAVDRVAPLRAHGAGRPR